MDQPRHMPTVSSHARILSGSDPSRCLDTVQLQRLEESFRRWAESSRNPSLRWSRMTNSSDLPADSLYGREIE